VKRAFSVLLVLLAPVMMFAVPRGPGSQFIPPEAGPYLSAEILQIQSEVGQQKLGEIDAATLFSIRERLSVAGQKDSYVRDMSLHSLALPGLGQFEMGDTGSGFAFLGLDLAAVAGTLVGVYYSLPSDLRFDRIDYFSDSFSTISNAWNGHTFVDYLPAIGVVMGGVIVDQIIRHWAARAANTEATSRIDSGSVKFTPRIGIGFMGFNVAY